MSRYHHRPENRRGWTAIRARAIRAAGRRCTALRSTGTARGPSPGRCRTAATHAQALEVVCRTCHFVEHHTGPRAPGVGAVSKRGIFTC